MPRPMLIELGRYPEATDLLESQLPNVLPGLSTIHLHDTWAHLAVRTGDLAEARRHLEIARVEASGIDDAQYVIDLCTWGTEIALWDGDPAAALAVARDGFDRLVDVDDAIILGQLAIPAAHAAADLAVRARAARDEAAAKDAAAAARSVIERYRASTERLTEPDELATQEIGWRMALCEAELARAAGEDDPARWVAVRPALAARPAPFLEAYVLWRAAEAMADRGETGAAAEPLREAHAIAARIGAALLSAGIETTARRLRVDLRGADRRASRRADDARVVEAGRPVRADDPRARGARPRRRGLHQPAHRRDAVHQREHGRRPRLEHPGQARRRDADRGGGGRGQARAGSGGGLAVAPLASSAATVTRGAGSAAPP